jgi:hypothetical protein
MHAFDTCVLTARTSVELVKRDRAAGRRTRLGSLPMAANGLSGNVFANMVLGLKSLRGELFSEGSGALLLS